MSILVAEDDEVYRKHLYDLLCEEMSSQAPIYVAADGKEALRLTDQFQPQHFILDIQMPGANGVEVAKAIWRKRSQARIIFWSQYSDEVYVRNISKLVPADTVYGYLLKGGGKEHFLAAVRAVLLEEQCVIDREIRGVHSRASSRRTGLTDVEYEALIDIALGLTDRAMAERRCLTKRGVQCRLGSLYVKLGVDSDQRVSEAWGNTFSPRNRAVRTAFERGLLNAAELEQEEKALQQWLATHQPELTS